MTTQEQDRTRWGTVVVPAYNEEDVIAGSLGRIVETLRRRRDGRRWEVLVVDDGSRDGTAHAALTAAARLGCAEVEIHVLQHVSNRGLGGALQSGFTASRGDVVVVLDCDLSYSPDHIAPLVEAVQDGRAQIALASPYMPGGATVAVPRALERRSRFANRFLARLSRVDLHTFTGMVRAYDGAFIRALPLRAQDDVINIETLSKAEILRARVVEIPAMLDWSGLEARAGRTRMATRRVRQKTYETLLRGILYRPYLVFSLGGMLAALLGAIAGVTAMTLPGPQVGLTVLGVSMVVTGCVCSLAAVISVQVKRGLEELYYQRSVARRSIVTVRPAVPVLIPEVRPAGDTAPEAALRLDDVLPDGVLLGPRLATES